jgi:hypothetical protein
MHTEKSLGQNNFTEETLTKAMSNRNQISFQYNQHGMMGGDTRKEQIGNARIILISTNKSGNSSIMLDLPCGENRAKKNIPSWRYFDVENMSDIQIVQY